MLQSVYMVAEEAPSSFDVRYTSGTAINHVHLNNLVTLVESERETHSQILTPTWGKTLAGFIDTSGLSSSLLPQKFNDRIKDVRMRYIQSLTELFPSLAKRLSSLANAEDGWDGRSAKSMSFESFGQLRRFLFKNDLFAADIGLYLDRDGILILSFTSQKNGLVDMTFCAGHILVCADEFEEEMSLEEASAFVRSA